MVYKIFGGFGKMQSDFEFHYCTAYGSLVTDEWCDIRCDILKRQREMSSVVCNAKISCESCMCRKNEEQYIEERKKSDGHNK